MGRILALARLGEDPQGVMVNARAVARASFDGSTLASVKDRCNDFVEDQSPDWRLATRVAWIRGLEREITARLGDMDPVVMYAIGIGR